MKIFDLFESPKLAAPSNTPGVQTAQDQHTPSPIGSGTSKREAKKRKVTMMGVPVSESGPFSYGAKKPRKGSVADLAAKKRQEQEKDQQPVEPRDHMVGVARVVKDVAEGKIKLSTDPNWYGAEVGDYKASGPIVNIPANRLVGFEPDDKMNQPASKANVKKIVAGLKQGAKLPPLLVRQYKNGYQVLDGHHRFWAYKLLDVKSIPAQVVPAKDIEEITKQGVAEGVEQQYLWHGSRQKIPMLEPRQSVDTGGAAGSNQNAIYATSDPKVAIAMGLTTSGSDTGMFPNDPQMVLFSGKIRKGENVYLHKVPMNGPDGKPQFVQGGNDREFHSVPGVKGIKPIEIKAVPVDKYLNLIRQATPQDLELRKKYMKQGVAEGSAQEKLYKRHQELRKKSGLPDPDYYKELKATYDLPDAERYAKAAELKKKYNVKEGILDRSPAKLPKPRNPAEKVLRTKVNAAGQHTNKKRQQQLQPKYKNREELDESLKGKLGAAALAGALSTGAMAGNLPDLKANVTMDIDGQQVTKQFNLGNDYSGPMEARKAVENFLQSKGINKFFITIERDAPGTPKASKSGTMDKSSYLDTKPYSPQDKDAGSYMQRDPYAATSPTVNYLDPADSRPGPYGSRGVTNPGGVADTAGQVASDVGKGDYGAAANKAWKSYQHNKNADLGAIGRGEIRDRTINTIKQGIDKLIPGLNENDQDIINSMIQMAIKGYSDQEIAEKFNMDLEQTAQILDAHIEDIEAGLDDLNEAIESRLMQLKRAGYDIIIEDTELCPECGGPSYSNAILAEKKDACYSKVKSRYKVWPSAYASGALVRCRKVGAKNWGNKSKK